MDVPTGVSDSIIARAQMISSIRKEGGQVQPVVDQATELHLPRLKRVVDRFDSIADFGIVSDEQLKNFILLTNL
jgi:hypothetical protein